MTQFLSNDSMDQLNSNVSRGSNHKIMYDGNVYKNNPTSDFETYKKKYLGYFAYTICVCEQLIILSMIYLTGTQRINLLGLGYLIACYFFLWFGDDLLRKRVDLMIRLYVNEFFLINLIFFS